VRHRCVKGALLLFAVVGAYYTADRAYWVYRLPHVVAPPFSFTIVEIRAAAESARPRARIYLDGLADPAELRFEGSSLKWQRAQVAYPRATIPFNGVVVTGTGSILFGRSRIDVAENKIVINGNDVQPLDFTVARSGAFRSGDIRIAR
jgi:hypothetical protein